MKTKITFGMIMLASIIISTTGCRKQPTATITTDKTTVEVGGAVKFTSTSVDADHVKWTFADGSTSDSKEVSYTFTSSGSKTVKLVAYSKKDKKSDEATVTINVNENQNFVGSYDMNENCTVNGPFCCAEIVISATGTNGIIISNFQDYDITVTGTVSGSNLTIPFQTVSGTTGDFDIDATGSISGNTLTYDYNIDYFDNTNPANDFSDYCSCSGTKQIAHVQDIRTGGKR